MEIRLQPLRIPSGCHVEYNNGLWEIDPNADQVSMENRWWIFKEDMLQITQPRYNRLLDVGWSPEGDLENGRYKLVVYEGDFNGCLLTSFETTDRVALVSEIERLLEMISTGKL